MTGEELRKIFCDLSHPCIIRQVKFADHMRYYPCIVLSLISGLKPGVVIFDGEDITIVDAADINHKPEKDYTYYPATDDVLAALMDKCSLG